MIDIEELLSHKELAHWSFGFKGMVRPTGRYIVHQDRDSYSVEIKTGLFSKEWVSSYCLRPVSKYAKARKTQVRWEWPATDGQGQEQ